MARIVKTYVGGSDEYLVTRRERRAFFGLIRWWEEVFTERIGSDIHVVTDRPIQTVYVNGEPWEKLIKKD